MKYLNNPVYYKKGYTFFFILFIFFSAIFCGYTKVTNLFHLSIIFFIITLILNKETRRVFFVNQERKRGFLFISLFLIYFVLSNLWSSNPRNAESTLTHSFYLIMFLAMLVSVLDSEKRNILLLGSVAGLTCLCLYCLLFEYQSILQERVVSAHNPGPTNVIDLAGYAAIGIILALMVYRDTKYKLILLTLPVFLMTMAISQSRGPIIALAVSFLIATPFRDITKKQAVIAAGFIAVFIAALVWSTMGELVIDRFEELYVQSFLRLSIWRHTFELIAEAPYFGHGFDYHLEFTNYSGEHIRTTHSLYFGTLLKGGVAGLILLLLVLINGLIFLMRRSQEGMRLELSLFLFMLFFYLSQGIFVISNPAEYWYLFWFPLAFTLVGKREPEYKKEESANSSLQQE